MSVWNRNAVVALTMAVFLVASSSPTQAASAPDEENQWDGYLACNVRASSGVNACGLAEIVAPGTTGDDFLQQFTVTEGLKTVVVAMQWDQSESSVQEDLLILFERETNDGYAREDGPSSLEFRVDAGDGHGEKDFENITGTWTLQFRVFAGAEANVVVDQPFTVHYHLFYDEHAPDGYSALPDS